MDPALVHHYFGSKADLFAAALRIPVNPREVLAGVLDGDLETLGERLMRRLLHIWSAGASEIGEAVVGLLRSAATNEGAARMLREFLSKEVLGPIAEALRVSQPQLRAALLSSQVIGLGLARYVLRLEPIASADIETLVTCYAPTLQRYLTGPLPGDDHVPGREGDAKSRRRSGL